MTERLKLELERTAALVNSRLSEICDIYEASPLFAKEMKGVVDSARYSLMAGGKRIRPFLVTVFCRLCGSSTDEALELGCALEMVHTYSLIHDDLPCMDNDDFRRGKPTNHKIFGEATAVLAGDALLTEAFSVIVNSKLPDSAKTKAVKILSSRSGMLGMIGGQEIDLSSEGNDISMDVLQMLQIKKTGMLIEAACLLGCIAADVTEQKLLDAASGFAHSFGLAFQITDDILDVTGNTEELGKNVGSDEKECKCTFVTHLGLDKARKYAAEQIELAKKYITDNFHNGDTDILCDLCDYLMIRKN